MEFLTRSECLDLLWQVRLKDSDVIGRSCSPAGLKRTASFTYKSRMKNADEVSCSLFDCFGDFSWMVLWPHEFVWGDRGREDDPPSDWRRYAQWRQRNGETRPLYDAPCHKFEPSDRANAATAIEFAIYTGWDAVAFADPLKALIRLSHDDYIELHVKSSDQLTAHSRALTALGLARSP